jgi:hypothetical protein
MESAKQHHRSHGICKTITQKSWNMQTISQKSWKMQNNNTEAMENAKQ